MDAAAGLTAALDLAAGPSLILDGHLRVVAASAGATALLGAVPLGTSAPALLCGGKPKRPIADALLAGEPVQATIAHPRYPARTLLVRAVHLPGTPRGWLLVLEDLGVAAGGELVFHGMRTADPGMHELFRLITRVADDDATVLIRGESGTGKELVARAIHQASARNAAPFVAINCAALPATLLEAELFGTVKGAFTGALKDTPGLIRTAQGGTLLLDEVADLPLELQAKLLRVLETHQVLPVGGHAPISVDVRVLSATHKSLRKEVAAGRFRADLMYRLRVVPLFLPALRERPGDIALLARQFVDELNTKSQRRQVTSIAPQALAVLQAWPWPGNVRELKNAIHYAFALFDGPVLRATDLPSELREEPARPLAMVDDAAVVAAPQGEQAVDVARLTQALALAHNRRDVAARALGVSRVTLWRWMKDAGLVRARRRAR